MSPFLLHILAINLLDLIGITAAKLYSIHKNPWMLVITVVMFAAAGFVFARSLEYEGAAIANVLWIALSVILVTIMGYFVFKEVITPLQFIGIGTITLGLILINLK